MRGSKGEIRTNCNHAFHANCVNLGQADDVFKCPECDQECSFFYAYYSDEYPWVLVDFRSYRKYGIPTPGSSMITRDPIAEQIKEAGEDGAPFECPICHQEMKNAGMLCAALTRCSKPHIYHTPCLIQWISDGHGACPVCKSAITKVYTNGRTFKQPEWDIPYDQFNKTLPPVTMEEIISDGEEGE